MGAMAGAMARRMVTDDGQQWRPWLQRVEEEGYGLEIDVLVEGK